jgi:hypothetical protein
MNRTPIVIATLVALAAGATACDTHDDPIDGAVALPQDAGANDAPESDAPAPVGSVPSTAVF